MREHRYSILDIHRMRIAVEKIMRTRMVPGQVYLDGEIHFTTPQEVETRLATYIAAGIDPYELDQEADRVEARWAEIAKKMSVK